ncbi:hypothetical protein Tco_0862176 [Tanacetum coccineum]
MLLIRSFSPTKFDESPCRYEPLHKGVTFRLGGVEREMSLLEFGWRVGLYTERESRDVMTLSGLRRAETVNYTHLTHLFWPSIGDDGFNVGNTKAKSIRDPRIKLAHRCITMTITGRKETTNRVTKIDLFYLYCIFGEGVVCNIPYWLAKYLKGVRDKSVIFGGVFVTKISWSFGLLTEEMVSVLNCEPPPHVYKKKSLVKMRVIMELHKGECCWPATRGVVEEDAGDDEEGDGEKGNEGAGGSADNYWNMSAGDWQVIFDEKKLGSRKAYLLEDKQIPSVGVFDEVFSIWKAFGGNTCDLGLFGEETDKTTDLLQHVSRLCSQRLETVSQDACGAVTIHPMTVSQESMTASARTTQPKI